LKDLQHLFLAHNGGVQKTIQTFRKAKSRSIIGQLLSHLMHMPNISFSLLKESVANEPLLSPVFNDSLIVRRRC
jgi:hypothetical protein